MALQSLGHTVDLTVTTWNIRGLAHHGPFYGGKLHEIDVLLRNNGVLILTETHLTTQESNELFSRFSHHKSFCAGIMVEQSLLPYHTSPSTMPSRSGGVAILVLKK